jgi:transposase
MLHSVRMGTAFLHNNSSASQIKRRLIQSNRYRWFTALFSSPYAGMRRYT